MQMNNMNQPGFAVGVGVVLVSSKKIKSTLVVMSDWAQKT